MRLFVQSCILTFLIHIFYLSGHLLYVLFSDFCLFYVGKYGLLISWENEHPSHVLILDFGQQIVSLLLISIFQFCNAGNLQLVFYIIGLELLKTWFNIWMLGFEFLKFFILTLQLQDFSFELSDFLVQLFKFFVPLFGLFWQTFD